MNIPQIKSIDTALRIYYTHSELGNKEIMALFGRLSSATVSRLKKAVKTEMHHQNIKAYGANNVNTAVAYDVWGINANDLEKRWKKLKELQFE